MVTRLMSPTWTGWVLLLFGAKWASQTTAVFGLAFRSTHRRGHILSLRAENELRLSTRLATAVATCPEIDATNRMATGNSNSKERSGNDKRKASLSMGNHPLLSLNMNLDALATKAAAAAADALAEHEEEDSGRQNLAAHRAQELFHRIAALYQEGYYSVPPDVVSFNSVLKAWKYDPVSAVAFWESATTNSSILIQPNLRSYNSVLLAFARAGLHQQATTILRSMERSRFILPDRVTYNTIFLAYDVALAKTSDIKDNDETVCLALDLWNEINGIHHHVQPDTITYNTMLSILVHSMENQHAAIPRQRGRKASSRTNLMNETAGLDETMTRVLSLFQELRNHAGIRPDVYTYGIVLQAYAIQSKLPLPSRRSGSLCRDSKQALKLFEEMRAVYKVEPNVIAYTNLMLVLVNNGDVKEATTMLHELIDGVDQTSTGEVASPRPDAVMFTVLMNGWARVAVNRPQEAVDAVMSLLQLMHRLDAQWSGASAPAGGRSLLTPNKYTYTSILKTIALAKLPSSPALVWDVLQRMKSESLPDHPAQTKVKPSIIHYNAALDACAKAPSLEKIQYGKQIWNMIQTDLQVSPDLITYNTLLNVAASSYGGDELRAQGGQLCVIAWRALRPISQPRNSDYRQANRATSRLTPNSLTYQYLLKAIRKCLPETDERARLVSEIWRACCQDGCVNEHVIQQMQFMVTRSSGVYDSHPKMPGRNSQASAESHHHSQSVLTQPDSAIQWTKDLRVEDLPAEWSQGASYSWHISQ
jgi:pentatricopeptide repeat protein